MDHKTSHDDEIKMKFDKKIIYSVIITAIVVFAISFMIFKYLPEHKQGSGINEYKKQIFDRISCQYKCPLTEQTYQDKTQTLPDATCVQQCASNLKTLQGNSIVQYSNTDLQNDNLFVDIEGLITSCRNTSLNQSASTPTLDNVKFFGCVVDGLDKLRLDYSYLD